MAGEFVVQGAEGFHRLSRALKEAGRLELRKELNKGLRRAAKPLIAQTREAARKELPKRGGLNEVVASLPQRVQVRTGDRTAGVRIVVSKTRRGGWGANKGTIRHPVFGNTQVWVNQEVPAGWFDETLSHGAPAVIPEIERAIQSTIDAIVKEAR